MKSGLIAGLLLGGAVAATSATAAEYAIDVPGMHASIMFKASHIGVSFVTGRFNRFDGTFTWDEAQPGASSVDVTIQVDSLDSNHAERDKHLRSKDYLNVEANPTARFKSTKYEGNASGGKLKGNLTLNGVTKEITIDVTRIGEAKDPWGGYRAGFQGKTVLTSSEFGWTAPSFPKTVEMEFILEGKRK
ncbi:MAG: YceI family protein [Gammaproteobacteria bacterium]|nr:YceI family protein [Gammaproteobacteria bacterium]